MDGNGTEKFGRKAERDDEKTEVKSSSIRFFFLLPATTQRNQNHVPTNKEYSMSTGMAEKNDDPEPWEGETNEEGDEELRISSEDGMAYSKLEFIAYFGGTAEWDASEIAHVVLDHNASKAEEAAAKAAAVELKTEATTNSSAEAKESNTVQDLEEREAEKKARAEEVKRVANMISKKEAEKQLREQLEKERLDEISKEKERQRRASIEEDIAEAHRVQEEQQEKQLKKKKKLYVAEEAAIAKEKADQKANKEVERAKRKAEEAKKAIRSAERAAKKAAKAQVSAREAMIAERSAKINAGLKVEDEDIFQAKIIAEEKKQQEQEQLKKKQEEEQLQLSLQKYPHLLKPETQATPKNKKNPKNPKHPKHPKHGTSLEEPQEPETNNTKDIRRTPRKHSQTTTINSTRTPPAFLSPRDEKHLHPDLPRYGVEHEKMNEQISEHEIEAGLTLRDIARQMEAERSIEVEVKNLQLKHSIQHCSPYYNSKKFEQSYQTLIKQQQLFKQSLCWDKDPEKKCMPISPRITSYYNPRISDSRKIPQKPISFGSTNKTPNAMHRTLKKQSKGGEQTRGKNNGRRTATPTKGEAYKYIKKKKKRSLNAKAMLESFVKNRKNIPPTAINRQCPIRDNNEQLCIVIETRSDKKSSNRAKKVTK